MSYIYKISNDINNLIYIGQTTGSILARFLQHCSESRYDVNNKFHKAMNELGIEHFKIEEIEKCSNELLDEREKYWIQYYDSYNNGYNSTKGGQSSPIKTDPDYCIQYYLNNKDNKTLTQITKELGVGTNALRELLQEKGIRQKQKYSTYQNWSKEEVNNIKKDIENHCSLNYLANKYHHDIRTLKKFMEDNNLKNLSVITNKKIPIWQLDKEGNFIKEWESIAEAKNYFNNQHIGECVNGKRKTAAGYKWIKKPI